MREKIAILSNTIMKMVVSNQEKVQHSLEFDRGYCDRVIGRDDNVSDVKLQKPAAISTPVAFFAAWQAQRTGRFARPLV